MADASSNSKMKSVHVPSCQVDQCERDMGALVRDLERQNVICVWESRGDYGPGGLYPKRFSQFYSQCFCTVIHVCPKILKKINQVSETVQKDPEKSFFVRIQSSPAEDSDFLLQFNITDLRSEEQRLKFVREIIREAGGGMQTTSPGQEDTTDQTQSCARLETDEYADTVSAVFELLVPVMRGADVCKPYLEKIHVAFVLTKEVKEIIDNLEKLSQKQLQPKDLPYLSHVTLQDLLKKKDIISLAQLACSRNARLCFQALHTIAFLLFDGGLKGFSHSTLKNTETVLFKAVEQVKCVRLNNDEYGCTELLVIVYLMVNAVCVMTCDHSETKCNIHTVSKRPLFHMKKSASFFRVKHGSNSTGSPEWLRVLSTCFGQWKNKTCTALSQRISTILRASEDQGVDEFSTQPELQLFLLIAGLIQSFKHVNPSKFLDAQQLLAKHSSRKQSTGNTTVKEIRKIMVSTAIFGLTIFLQHRTVDLTSSDKFEDICFETVRCLNNMLNSLDKENREQCLYYMTSLLFHSNKAIRQHTSFLFRQQMFYHHHMWTLLQCETDFLLWPMLTFPRATQDSLKSHHSWFILQSLFNDRFVLTHIHRPTATNHLRQNSTRDRNLQKDQYFCELSFLKGLQHSSIVELVSYLDRCCPQFYITEDYQTKALQTILVNKSKNNDQFSISKLVQMLVEALEGIQFCHERGYIHRDLTSASLFISTSSNGRIKLANFKQMRKLAGKDYIREFDCVSIPTRWSAPESHRRCFFSVASDMWMVGHMMYEVLTHGRMPYTDVAKSDEDLMPMVVKGEQTLCCEPCIPTSISSIIQQLTVIAEADRILQAGEVADRLKLEISNSSFDGVNDDHSFFPNLNVPRQAATEHKKGLVLSLVEDYKSPPTTGIEAGSEDMDIDESGYINFGPHRGLRHFREPCPADFSSEVWSILTQEKLSGITPIIGHPERNANGQQELPFAIPAELLCSLKDAVLTRWLGDDIEPYIICLRQLATVISQLHSHGLILCDFAADTIHVEKFATNPPKYKVWVASLPSMNLLPQYSQASAASTVSCFVHLDPPEDAEKKRRAAGEVLQYGQYSTASDVHCYSILVWWVFNAFDHTSAGHDKEAKCLEPLENIPEKEVYENISVAYHRPVLNKPESCPPHIYQRIKECWQSQRHERPVMKMLEAYMTLNEPQGEVMLDDLQDNQDYFEVDNASDAESVYSDIDHYSIPDNNVGQGGVKESETEEVVYSDGEYTSSLAVNSKLLPTSSVSDYDTQLSMSKQAADFYGELQDQAGSCIKYCNSGEKSEPLSLFPFPTTPQLTIRAYSAQTDDKQADDAEKNTTENSQPKLPVKPVPSPKPQIAPKPNQSQMGISPSKDQAGSPKDKMSEKLPNSTSHTASVSGNRALQGGASEVQSVYCGSPQISDRPQTSKPNKSSELEETASSEQLKAAVQPSGGGDQRVASTSQTPPPLPPRIYRSRDGQDFKNSDETPADRTYANNTSGISKPQPPGRLPPAPPSGPQSPLPPPPPPRNRPLKPQGSKLEDADIPPPSRRPLPPPPTPPPATPQTRPTSPPPQSMNAENGEKPEPPKRPPLRRPVAAGTGSSQTSNNIDKMPESSDDDSHIYEDLDKLR